MRCQVLECDNKSHAEHNGEYLFCHEWLPIPRNGTVEQCTECGSKFATKAQDE